MKVSGPMFEPSKSSYMRSIFGREGAHYNIFQIDEKLGMEVLRKIFPEGEANEYNFVLFSTSGVHGTYRTIEDIEESLKKYGDHDLWENSPDDYTSPYLTLLMVHPRIVCLRYGEIKISLDDINFLKKLRESSVKVVQQINSPEES